MRIYNRAQVLYLLRSTKPCQFARRHRSGARTISTKLPLQSPPPAGRRPVNATISHPTRRYIRVDTLGTKRCLGTATAGGCRMFRPRRGIGYHYHCCALLEMTPENRAGPARRQKRRPEIGATAVRGQRSYIHCAVGAASNEYKSRSSKGPHRHSKSNKTKRSRSRAVRVSSAQLPFSLPLFGSSRP